MHYPASENQLLNNEKVKPKYKENDPDYKGTEMRSELAEGVIESRSCTDLIFLILFIAFWAGMISIAFIAIKRGQPNRLASPFDSDGKQYKILILNKKWLFYLFLCVKVGIDLIYLNFTLNFLLFETYFYSKRKSLWLYKWI